MIYKGNNFNKIWETCKKFNIAQDREEFKGLWEILLTKTKRINCLELGSYYGGTTYAFANIFTNVFVIDYIRQKEWKLIEDNYKGVKFMEYKTQSKIVKETIKDLKIKFDLIFIDADHLYEPVNMDYNYYKEFLADDGYLAFHDINPNHMGRACEVNKLWEEIKGDWNNYTEIINKKYKMGGIGLLND